MPDRADVAIIGAGIIGCAIAHRLAHEGASVLVIERSARGAEASAAAAGILSPQAEASERDPFFELCMRSRDLHAALAAHLQEEVAIDVEYSAAGVLHAALDEETRPALESTEKWQRDEGLLVASLDHNSAIDLEPNLTPQVKAALYFPEDAHVNNVALTRALAAAAERQGARFQEGSDVVGLSISGNRVNGVDTTRGAVSSNWVINAAGAWAGSIDRRLSNRLPIRPVRGQMAALGSAANLIGRVIYSEECYLVPRQDGRVIVGSTMEDVGYDKNTTASAIHRLMGAAIRLVPKLSQCPVDSFWAGLRPASPDGRPVLGADPEFAGLIHATGHFRNGILLAPVSAEIISDLVVRGRASIDLSPFRLERFTSVAQ